MPTDIKLKNSVTATNAPTSLQQGEVAINITDKKVWVGNAATTPVLLLGSGADGTFTNLTVSGVASFADGTVSLPSITNIGDTNTGIFFPAADTIAFTEGGVESMRINSSGQLDLVNNPIFTGGTANGILYLNGSKAATSGSALTFDGTNFSTSNSMRVTGSTASYASGTGTEITYISASTKGGIQVYDRTANAYRNVYIDGANALIQTGGTERMRIDSAGNVGIGTTSPIARVQIAGVETATYTTALTTNTLLSSAAPSSFLYVQNDADTDDTFCGIAFNSTRTGGNGNTSYIANIASSSNNAGILAFGTRSGSTTLAERMRIDSSGNVGIGTTAPLTKLSVADVNVTGNDANISVVTTTTQAAGVGGTLGLGGLYDATNSIFFGTVRGGKENSTSGNYAGFLSFGTVANGSSITEKMRIDSSGNVLIGKTSATANGGDLQVSSGITFPATQVAKTDANTLDDYEEGTFTPTIIGLSTAGTGTYTTQVGTYTKIGNTVTVAISLTWTAHTGSGTMAISSLPFTAATAVSREWMAIPEFVNMTMPASTIPFAYIGSAFTNIRLHSMAVGTGATTALALDTAATVYLSLTYLTA